MAISEGVTEVLDSEDEPLTSSPGPRPDGIIHQLDGAAEQQQRDASLNTSEEIDANKVAEHDQSLPDASDETTAQTNSLSNLPEPNANELEVSHEHELSPSGSSNHHASVPIDPVTQQSLNQQEYQTEPTSSDEKKPSVAVKEGIVGSVHDTPISSMLLSGPSSCSDQCLPVVDDKHSTESEQQTSYPGREVDNPTFPAAESRSPNLLPLGDEQSAWLHSKGPKRDVSPLNRRRGLEHGPEAEQINQSPDDRAYHRDGRGSSCPPDVTPRDVSDSKYERAFTRSATTDAASLTRQKTWHATLNTVALARVDLTLKEAPSPEDHNTLPSRTDMDVNPEPGHDLEMQSIHQDSMHTNVPAEKHVAISAQSPGSTDVVSPGTKEADDAIKLQPRDEDGLERTEAKVQPDTAMVAESASSATAAVLPANPDTQAPPVTTSGIQEIQPTPAKSAQEITLAELKAQRAALITSLAGLPKIRELIIDAETPDTEPTESEVMAAAHKINKKHIKLLHEYNEMKDVGQGLMGLIADQRGVRIVEVQDEFGIDAKD